MRLNENEPGCKTERYFQRTSDGKLILRKMMTRYIPARSPTAREAGLLGARRELVQGREHRLRAAHLYHGQARIYDFLDRKAVLGLVDEHLAGRENRRLLIWSLLNLESWCREFL